MTQISMPEEVVEQVRPMVCVITRNYSIRPPGFLRVRSVRGVDHIKEVDNFHEATKYVDRQRAVEVLTRAQAGGVSSTWHIQESPA